MYGGRSRGSRGDFNRKAAYPYRGENSKYLQHDDRSDRDRESGEFHPRRGVPRGRYEQRGRGERYRGSGGWRGGPPRRSRGGPYRGGRGGRYHQPHGSGYTDEDGDTDMDGDRRPKPYERPTRSRGRYNNSRGNDTYLKRTVKNETQWSLITVVDGGMLDEAWVIDAIQKETLTIIKPVQYYNDGQNSSFCIKDEEIAQTIKDCSKKIEAPDGSKLFILKARISPPIMDDKLPILKDVLLKRFNMETNHLDASNLFFDDTLRKNGIELKPRFAKDIYILMNMVGPRIVSELVSLDMSGNRMDTLSHLKNYVVMIPRLKSLKLAKNELKHSKDLDSIREWDLKELNLDGNPLCQNYSSQSDYISAMRDRFPNLEVLDGKKLPPPVKFDLEKVTKLVPPTPNHIPQQVTEIIKQFVKQYFALYDTNRENLLQAYDENCMFSLLTPTSHRGAPLSQYYKLSRNLHRMKNPKNKISTLKRSRSEVCSTLKELPMTEHDIAGFNVDVPLVSPNLLKFIIRGVFKEKNSGKGKTIMRAFSRSFLCLTDGSRLSVINEELYIRNTTSMEFRTAFAKPPVTPSPSPVPEHVSASPIPATPPVAGAVASVTSPSKMDMIAAFVKESGMNFKFSEQCLAENNWDYMKAGQAFLQAKGKGMIPPEAFAS